MKCRSVACIWSSSPPSHRVTATAVVASPPTLYTGGADGSILCWCLPSAADSHQEIKPVAVLCGHAAPIVDLTVCYPVSTSEDGVLDDSCNLGTNSSLGSSVALLSACSDGVLCVWSRISGHCRRRRKMPPWVGCPLIVQTLPLNPRYVCIACSFIDAAHVFDSSSVDSMERLEPLGNEDSQQRRPPKCTLVIVDSYSLSIVQTVFHGCLSIGPLKFMFVVSSIEDRKKQSAVIVDSSGKLQLISILKDSNVNGESGNGLVKNFAHSETTVWADGLNEAGKVVAASNCESILALVYRTCCIFRLVDEGRKIGTISLSDSHLFIEGSTEEHVVIGGMFLESGAASGNTHETKKFAVWNNRGSAVIYLLSYVDNIFNFEPLYQISALTFPPDARLSVCFVKLNSLFLRVESFCFHVEEPFLWRPHVTIWSLNEQVDDHRKLWRMSKMLGKGGFWVNRDVGSNSFSKTEHLMHNSCSVPVSWKLDLDSGQGFVPWADDINDGFLRDQIVSSSMVISDNFNTPYAIVYGFYSGEIELVQFSMFLPRIYSCRGSPHLERDVNVPRRHFRGHTGAILCLGAHQMVGMYKGRGFNKVLISGGIDCTLRLWDLDTSCLITIMHQHVAPIRQLIFPPPITECPWNDCFLSVGEDGCVSLASLETLRVERMFPGHPNYPAKVVWDGARGYIACLCRNVSAFDAVHCLYIWDIKTGARERILRGTAANSMFEHFCRSININSIAGSLLSQNTSASSLFLPLIEDTSSTSLHMVSSMMNLSEPNLSQANDSSGKSTKRISNKVSILESNNHPIKCSSPFPGIATLSFDLASMMSSFQKHEVMEGAAITQKNSQVMEQSSEIASLHGKTTDASSNLLVISINDIEEHEQVRSIEGCLLRFSLSFLHLWGVDLELDKLLKNEMMLERPDEFIVASGLQGDRGSLTVTLPGLTSSLELWKSSSEFCAMRSLTMVSLAQCMISMSHTSSAASSALAAFYARNFVEKIPDIKPPSLQLLVSFWQDKSEHVRMAARSLFHCAASRAIPLPLCNRKASNFTKSVSFTNINRVNEESSISKEDTSSKLLDSEFEQSKIISWLESYEVHDWISCVGGTSQDAMTSHIIVAAALAIWYPSIVKPSLSMVSVHPLIKLVMAMNEKYSSTAAELLAEGMETTWKAGIGSEISRLMGDIFFQIECVSGPSSNLASQSSALSNTIRDTLVSILLPSLAMADIPGFLSVIDRQIWTTLSDSPIHLVSLMTLIRVVRGSPKNLAQYLDKVVNFILQTIDPGNSVMRRTCLQSAMAALKEVVRVFPMVALNESSTRLAVGDAIGEIKHASIRVYDLQSVTKVKDLDASGPLGLPKFLAGASEAVITTAISALSFSPDGEGLVAFSEQGLMIRWWSLGSVWWEKLSRNFVPVQCTKLIFVPPWEGFSPNSSRSSIMASIMGDDRQTNSQEITKNLNEADNIKLLIHNLDLSYHLEWLGDRKVLLTRHGHELGTFPL